MLSLDLLTNPKCRRILCLGAHSDDIEIGCGGTLLRLFQSMSRREVLWVVCSGDGRRTEEARASASRFLDGATATDVRVLGFRDGYFPWEGGQIKDAFKSIASEFQPDLVFTHCRADWHQDHRVVNELTWNHWRDHLILEYEIPKYDANPFEPSVYVPLDGATLDRKSNILLDSFTSQSGKAWFTTDTFRAIARIRGIECNSPTGFAEAFCGRKLWMSA